MTERIYHLVSAADQTEFRALGKSDWSPASLASEGFIHLSFGRQIAGTLELHFRTASEVLLVEVDRERVREALKLEVSRDEQAFPHIYRALSAPDFLRAWHLRRAADGTWPVPQFGLRSQLDTPPGSPLPCA